MIQIRVREMFGSNFDQGRGYPGCGFSKFLQENA
jgi:hypothetical protein